MPQASTSPWLLWVILMLFLSSADRVSGNPVSYYEVKEFAEYTNTLLFNELKRREEFSIKPINKKEKIKSGTG